MKDADKGSEEVESVLASQVRNISLALNEGDVMSDMCKGERSG